MAKQKKRGPGRPPKNKTKIEVKKAQRVSAREVKAQNHIEAGSFGLESRDAINKQAEEFNRQQALDEAEGIESSEVIEETTEEATETVEEEVTEESTETAPEEVEEEAVTEASEQTEEETTDTVTEETETESATETAEFVKEVKPDTKEEAIKTVPHGAFHAEREMKKEALAKVKELERKLTEAQGGQQTEQTTEEYVDPELEATNKRLDAIEADTRASKKAQDKIDFDNNVRIVHESLLEQGIDGFDTIGRDIVDSKLRRMYAEEPEIAMAHDNPEGWAKLYLEAVPSLQKIGQTQNKSDLFDEKKEAKRQAQLITTSGKKTETSAQSKKKKTPEQEYLEGRSSTKI